MEMKIKDEITHADKTKTDINMEMKIKVEIIIK